MSRCFTGIRSVLLVSLAAISLACSGNSKSASSGGKLSSPPDVKPTPAVLAMAQNPTPPANASLKATAGAGKLSVNTANNASDTDSFWVVSMDIDGDGVVEETQCLYDNEDGVLYLYSEDDIKCQGGGTCKAALLIALNCKGNPRNRPVGSGWCAVYLDAGECGAGVAGIYGCRFDQNGNPTEWAAARIDQVNDELIVTVIDVKS